MFIDLRKTPEGLSSAKTVLSFSSEYLEMGEVGAEFPAEVSIRRDGGSFYVTISYVCMVTQECARCCESFAVNVEGIVSFILAPFGFEDIGDDDLDVYLYESETDQIDFSQTVYDDCVLRLSAKPLCNQECLGFQYEDPLPEEVQVSETMDTRWSALTTIKNR